jgi:low temperature requirement protein LtrA
VQAHFLPTGEGHRVTTLELLFDLVFVFAITAVSGSVADELTPVGVAQGLVVMALIWFGWAAYAWLGNQARADEGPLRLSMYLAMAGYFVAALTIQEAFHDQPGGLRGPVVFVVAYAVIRLAHLVIYLVAAGNDAGLRRTIHLALGTTSVTVALLLVGALLEPGPRLAVWTVAVLVDYVGVYVGGAAGWRVLAPGHFAERHGLVIIIAIGESLVSVGTAVSHTAIHWRLVIGALLGVTLAITLWRTYFNAIAVAVEKSLRERVGDDRTRMARDVFTYLHFPAVVGIVGMAVGLGVTLDRVALSAHDLPGTAMATLYGGAALYLVALSVLRWRVLGRLSVPRLALAGCLVVVGVLLSFVHPPPLLDVAVVTFAFLGLTTFDALRYGSVTRTMRLASSD